MAARRRPPRAPAAANKGKRTPRGAQPIEVGRIPSWWMECTPHYVLDIEEAERKRRFDATMAFYYSQLAAADDAGILGPDGKPIMGPDGQPLAWHGSPWAGRNSPGGGFNGLMGGPGGRNFKIQKDIKIDPTLFGIQESDPDYHSYLTGAKLPPAFLEKMQEMMAEESMANNVHQTDYGRYGPQAEKPAFQPSWAKMKLKTTSNSEFVYRGEDSTESQYRRRLQGSADPIKELQSSQPNTKLVRKTRKVRREKPKTATSSSVGDESGLDSFIDHQPPKYTTSISTLGQESLVRPQKTGDQANEKTVRTGRHNVPISPTKPEPAKVPLAIQVALAAQQRSAAKQEPPAPAAERPAPKSTPSWRQNAPAPTSKVSSTPSWRQNTPAAPIQSTPSWRQKKNTNTNYGAGANHSNVQLKSVATPKETVLVQESAYTAYNSSTPATPAAVSKPWEHEPHELQHHHHHHHEQGNESYYEETVVLEEYDDDDEEIVEEEEFIEEEFYDDETYEEMELTDSAADLEDEDLQDLQAILAQRQEELARLEAGY